MLLDIAKIDSRSGANAGAWLHLKHPGTGELLYANPDNKEFPVRVKLLGMEAQAIRDVYDNSRRV